MNDTLTALFVGDLNYYSKGHSRLNAMKQLGISVEALRHSPSGGDKLGFTPPSLAFRIGWKLGIHLDSEDVNKAILHAVRSSHYDIIWIEKGNMIKPATLKAVRRQSPMTKILSYSDDDMFAPLNRTRAYTSCLQYYDIVFTTKSYNTNPDELPALGARRCIMIDKAFDPEQHLPLDLSESEHDQFQADVGFIGSYAPEREEVLSAVANSGIQVRVWGNGWNGVVSQSDNLRIEHRPLVNAPDNMMYSKGINATKINIGFLRKVNRDLQTDRSVEIPACGGFMLAERSSEHERLFEDKKEAVYFDTTEDLIAKIKYYLDHEDERATIAAAGRERCLANQYSHYDRMRFMLDQTLDE
jgi:spore maturation protein CgeB